MSAIEQMNAELERFYAANGVRAERLIVPPDLLHEALTEASCLVMFKPTVGNGNLFNDAVIEHGDKLQARARPIDKFVIVKG